MRAAGFSVSGIGKIGPGRAGPAGMVVRENSAGSDQSAGSMSFSVMSVNAVSCLSCPLR
jgi:hypothetical protein